MENVTINPIIYVGCFGDRFVTHNLQTRNYWVTEVDNLCYAFLLGQYKDLETAKKKADKYVDIAFKSVV